MQALRNIAGKKSIITKSQAGNEGKIVTCIRLATEEEKKLWNRSWNPDALWVLDTHLNSVNRRTGEVECVRDCQFDSYMVPLQDLNETEQQVQELYAPSPKTKKVVDKNRTYNYTPDF